MNEKSMQTIQWQQQHKIINLELCFYLKVWRSWRRYIIGNITNGKQYVITLVNQP